MLATSRLVLRRELRRRAVAFLGLAAIVALGGGVAIGALVAAHRTDRAYPDYVGDAEVVDLVVNPSLATRAIDTAIRGIPGVQSVHSDSLFLASVSKTEAGTAAELAGTDATLQVRGSTDGRYEAVDRPVITDGRFASRDHEVFVTEDYREDLEAAVGHPLRVGDTIEMAFLWSGLEAAEPEPDDVIEPIGVEQLRIAGFGRLADEMLPDELYPRQRLIVSADVARRYTCLGDLRADMDEDEALNALYPPDCARSYEYYAMQVAGGRPGKAAVRRAFTTAAERLTKDIPPSANTEGPSYFYVSQDRAEVDEAVSQVTRPTVAALTVFGLVAGVATLAIATLAISRLLRRNADQQRSLHAMGATRRARAVVGAGPPLVAGIAGIILAIPVALATSVVGPTGSVRAVTPSPGFALPGRVVLPVIALLGTALVVLTGTLAWSVARRAVRPVERQTRRRGINRLFGTSGRPAFRQGVQAAFSTQATEGGGLVLAGCVITVTVMVAAVVYGTNLAALVREPARYGWPWDVAVITGAGYGDTDAAKVAQSLDGHDAVDDYGLFAFDASIPIADRPVPTIFGFPGTERTSFPLIEGRAASGPGEAVLGATTAGELGVSVGDRVPIESEVPGLRSVTVVGIGVLPSLGSFIADRTGLGTGAFVLIDVDPSDPEQQSPAALTAIRLRPDADPKEFLADLKPEVQGWDVFQAPPTTHAAAVRPPEIVNADSMQSTPLALGGVLAAGLLLGLALSIGVSVRDRRRELATLRALGFSRADLRATVRWQAIASIAVGLALGMPLGVVAGRFAWAAFADQLGVVSRVDIPVAWLAVLAVIAIGLGLAAAAVPARTAARIHANELVP